MDRGPRVQAFPLPAKAIGQRHQSFSPQTALRPFWVHPQRALTYRSIAT